MRILFLGVRSGTSLHRANALERLGHQVYLLDPFTFVPQGKMAEHLHYETGGLLCAKRVMHGILSTLEGKAFDLTWVDKGRYVGPQLVAALRQRYGPVVNYNQDDPYGNRDRGSWLLYRRAVHAYDLVVVMREENIAEAQAKGAKQVMRIYFLADEIAHSPHELTVCEQSCWSSDVLFLGTAMPERGPFMVELLKQDVPLAIYGNRWQKLKEWPILRNAWKGPGTTTDAEYAGLIQCAKICLGLVSKGNRDLHTTRSMEIPSLGGLFCAERTREHQQLYVEGEEAVFWNDAEECASVCKTLLYDDARRRQIAMRGRQRFLINGHTNEKVLARILKELLKEDHS